MNIHLIMSLLVDGISIVVNLSLLVDDFSIVVEWSVCVLVLVHLLIMFLLNWHNFELFLIWSFCWHHMQKSRVVIFFFNFLEFFTKIKFLSQKMIYKWITLQKKTTAKKTTFFKIKNNLKPKKQHFTQKNTLICCFF